MVAVCAAGFFFQFMCALCGLVFVLVVLTAWSFFTHHVAHPLFIHAAWIYLGNRFCYAPSDPW
jgi:hypothetical protein